MSLDRTGACENAGMSRVPTSWSPIVLLVLGGCLGRGASSTVQRPQPVAAQDGVVRIADASRAFIGVETVTGEKSDSQVTAPARVEFKDGAVFPLGVPLSGRVASVHVGTGDRVGRGDPLVTLDCPEAASIRASIESARANQREAEANLDRQVRMLDEGVGVARDRLAAETRVSDLRAQLTSLEAQAAFIGSGTGTQVTLRAPLSGTVITRKASAGMAVQPGAEPIVEIGDSSALWVVADVFERDLALVHAGAAATVRLTSLETPLRGRVSSIGTIVASGLRTAPVRIVLEPGGPSMRAGMFGRVQIEASQDDITLPTDAVLIKDGKESVVYVQRDAQTFVRRTVTVAQHLGNGRVQIASGLSPGERVVVKGALLLDGAADQLL